jgi:hypothetical protein
MDIVNLTALRVAITSIVFPAALYLPSEAFYFDFGRHMHQPDPLAAAFLSGFIGLPLLLGTGYIWMKWAGKALTKAGWSKTDGTYYFAPIIHFIAFFLLANLAASVQSFLLHAPGGDRWITESTPLPLIIANGGGIGIGFWIVDAIPVFLLFVLLMLSYPRTTRPQSAKQRQPS